MPVFAARRQKFDGLRPAAHQIHLAGFPGETRLDQKRVKAIRDAADADDPADRARSAVGFLYGVNRHGEPDHQFAGRFFADIHETAHTGAGGNEIAGDRTVDRRHAAGSNNDLARGVYQRDSGNREPVHVCVDIGSFKFGFIPGPVCNDREQVAQVIRLCRRFTGVVSGPVPDLDEFGHVKLQRRVFSQTGHFPVLRFDPLADIRRPGIGNDTEPLFPGALVARAFRIGVQKHEDNAKKASHGNGGTGQRHDRQCRRFPKI